MELPLVADWQEPLAAVILEFDPRQLIRKVEKAEEAITNRINELAFAIDNEHEVRALYDGLSIIQGVEQDRLSWAASAFLRETLNRRQLEKLGM